MARLLILASEVPRDVADGWHMRVFNLCRYAADRHELQLHLFPAGPGIETGSQPEWFEQVYVHREYPVLERRRGRLLRTTDADYLRRWSPGYFDSVRRHLEKTVDGRQVDAIVYFGGRIAEIPPLLETPSIIDITDSRTLTLERRLANRDRQRSIRTDLELRLKKWRTVKRERQLIRAYDVVTTIAAGDQQRMIEISGKEKDRVRVVPNGVAEGALAASDKDRSTTRSVVFWGNLDFSPNKTAIAYFDEKIFSPFLASRGVEWHIAGGGGGELVAELARKPNVHVHGYVEDLYGFLSDKGLMINPMVEGSGMKNKVLEAFASGLPVVSTSMGIEAISAVDKEHFRLADSPEDFAKAITELLDNTDGARSLATNARRLVENAYTWDAACARFDDAIQKAMCG